MASDGLQRGTDAFELIYDGPGVRGGSISAKDLIEAVSGVSRAFSIIADEYDSIERYDIRIRDLEHSSVHILFEAIALAKDHPITAATLVTAAATVSTLGLTAATNIVTGAYRVLTDLGVIIEVKKKLEGRRVARLKAKFPEGQVELETGQGLVILTKEQYELLLSQRLDRQLAQIVSPLVTQRIDTVQLRQEDRELANVNVNQRDYFDYKEIVEERSKEETQIIGTLNSLNKTNLRGTFHTSDGFHVPYRYVGGNLARLLRGFASREPVRVAGKITYGSDDVPRSVEIQDVEFLQRDLLQT